MKMKLILINRQIELNLNKYLVIHGLSISTFHINKRDKIER